MSAAPAAAAAVAVSAKPAAATASETASAPSKPADASSGAAASTGNDEKGWCAMESNPEVLSKFMANLGVAKNFAFTDMLGTDPDLMAMIPAPVLAVVLLFPMVDSNASSSTGSDAKATATGTATATATAAAPAADGKAKADEPFFVVQVSELNNACGTVATLHAIFNSPAIQATIDPKSPIVAFMKAAATLSPADRGALLARDKAIKSKHDSHVVQGQTVSSGDAEEDTEHHFVVYIPFNGNLYELDGMKSAPLLRGKLTSADSFLPDAAKAIEKHYLKNPDFGGSASFSMLAITANADAL